ncbi:MAG: phosphatidate cytidylyltransferase, partial [Flavobacteriales bacterium]|nr:phosphatidate cytidylyltransferase [Flavobacteriales bacterium]
WKRAITGALLVSAMVMAMFFGIEWLSILFFLCVVIGTGEWMKMMGRKVGPDLSGTWAWLSSVVTYSSIVGNQLGWWDAKYILLCVPFLIVLIVFELFRKKAEIQQLGVSILGAIMVPMSFGLMVAMSSVNGVYSPYIPLGFFIFLWINDTGAYLVGRSFGKTPLISKISPKKTVEGFVGGVALALAASFIWSSFELGPLERKDWIVFALIVAVFSNFGDFTESMLKRHYGIKDSGRVFPGHGGILDRFDGLLLAVPLLFIYLFFRYS